MGMLNFQMVQFWHMTSCYVNSKFFSKYSSSPTHKQQTAGGEAMSEFSVMTAGVGSHKVEK